MEGYCWEKKSEVNFLENMADHSKWTSPSTLPAVHTGASPGKEQFSRRPLTSTRQVESPCTVSLCGFLSHTDKDGLEKRSKKNLSAEVLKIAWLFSFLAWDIGLLLQILQ